MHQVDSIGKPSLLFIALVWNFHDSKIYFGTIMSNFFSITWDSFQSLSNVCGWRLLNARFIKPNAQKEWGRIRWYCMYFLKWDIIIAVCDSFFAKYTEVDLKKGLEAFVHIKLAFIDVFSWKAGISSVKIGSKIFYLY